MKTQGLLFEKKGIKKMAKEELKVVETEDTEIEAVESEILTDALYDNSREGVFILSESIMTENGMIDTLNYDFNKITPREYKAILKRVNQAKPRGQRVTFAALDEDMQEAVFARAVNLAVPELQELDLDDYLKGCDKARDFLLHLLRKRGNNQ